MIAFKWVCKTLGMTNELVSAGIIRTHPKIDR